MQTTAVQWLAEMLEDCRYRIEDAGHLIDQANKMFEQQMKEAVLNQVTTHPRFRKIFEEQFEHWFNETYGSNKNDEYTEINWGGVIQKIPQEQLEKEINPNYKYFDIRVPTSSQTEISDEEIEKPSLTKELNVFLRWVIMRYSTITTDGLMFGWVDSMGNEVSAEEIVNHYKASMDELFKDFDEWYREQLKSRQ